MDFLGMVMRDAARDATLPPLRLAAETVARAIPDYAIHSMIQSRGAAVICFGDPARGGYAHSDQQGLVAVKGVVTCALQHNDGQPTERLRADILSGQMQRLDTYEGAFAACGWDPTQRRGVLLVDAAATIHLYFAETPTAVWFSTLALPLGRMVAAGLEGEAVRQFLVRGVVTAPLSMFRGVRRLDFGQHAEIAAGKLQVSRHWLPYRDVAPCSFRTAATRLSCIARHCVRAVADVSGPIVCDLTSGYDSRLVVAAARSAGIPLAITVNGDHESFEVRVAKMAAERLNCPFHHFIQRDTWNRAIDRPLLREMLYRTNGEMTVTNIYHQQLTRPRLAQHFALHLHGAAVGSDVARYYCWSQEFHRIGQRRLPEMERLLRYRFLQKPRPSADFFQVDPFPEFQREIVARIRQVCDSGAGRRNTEMLDAIHLWKNTAFISAYTSATFGLLPTMPPLNNATFIRTAMGTPLRHKLTTNLVRQVIFELSPELARLPTHYGNTAEPIRWTSLHRELFQAAERSLHFARKLDRVYLKGRVTGRFRSLQPVRSMVREVPLPIDHRSLSELLADGPWATRALYTEQGMRYLLDPTHWTDPVFLRLLTLELLCQEIAWETPSRLPAGGPA